mmetsp:Transcript_22347/g.52819  ORF Transcript_22347/g.52819 Transcript_22347/m.52819 type:complete len:185 (+) Transcript_22347:203-757(+)
MATFNEPGHFYAPPQGAHMQSQIPVAEGVPTVRGPDRWRTGLMSFSGAGNCIAFCAPCITFGEVAEYVRVDEACCGGDFGAACATCACCPWFYCCLLQQFSGAVRKRFEIPGGCASDCASAILCPCCLLLRMKREFVARGAQTQQEVVRQQQEILNVEQEQSRLYAPEAANTMPGGGPPHKTML